MKRKHIRHMWLNFQIKKYKFYLNLLHFSLKVLIILGLILSYSKLSTSFYVLQVITRRPIIGFD
jgi:hypothetical protein